VSLGVVATVAVTRNSVTQLLVTLHIFYEYLFANIINNATDVPIKQNIIGKMYLLFSSKKNGGAIIIKDISDHKNWKAKPFGFIGT
jgi:hypothetical protein